MLIEHRFGRSPRRTQRASPFIVGWLLATLGMAVLLPSFAVAANLDEITRAIPIIDEAADHMCATVQTAGSTTNTKVAGDVKAQLNGIFSKFADLGGSADISHTVSNFEGVLQSDLVTALQNQAQCKTQVLTTLVNKLFPDAGPVTGTVESLYFGTALQESSN